MEPSAFHLRSHNNNTSKNANGPPPGYIPGLGRGAVGFTTRSDGAQGAAVVGDGTKSRSAEARLVKQQQQQQQQNESERFKDPEDEAADAVWEQVDQRMQERKKRKRQSESDHGAGSSSIGAMATSSSTSTTAGTSKTSQIGAQFRELKEQLATVTDDQWAAIPDVGDYSLKYKQKQRKKKDSNFTPVSDTLLEQRHLANTTTAPAATSQPVLDGGTTTTNMSGLSAARGTVLGMSLDKQQTMNSNGIGGTATSVDPKGYLTSMQQQSSATATTAELHDITKARLLLQSVRDTNPHHGPGWIAAARVEETAGNV